MSGVQLFQNAAFSKSRLPPCTATIQRPRYLERCHFLAHPTIISRPLSVLKYIYICLRTIQAHSTNYMFRGEWHLILTNPSISPKMKIRILKFVDSSTIKNPELIHCRLENVSLDDFLPRFDHFLFSQELGCTPAATRLWVNYIEAQGRACTAFVDGASQDTDIGMETQ
jgi:hypothetical protein